MANQNKIKRKEIKNESNKADYSRRRQSSQLRWCELRKSGLVSRRTTNHEISEEEWQEILNQRQAENEEDNSMVQSE